MWNIVIRYEELIREKIKEINLKSSKLVVQSWMHQLAAQHHHPALAFKHSI